MSDSEKIRKYEWIVPVVLIVAAFFGGDYYGQRKIEKSLVSERDTTTKIVTVYKDFPKPLSSVAAGMIPVPKYMLYPDSVMVEVPVPVPGKTDTVYLPREQKYYEEEEGRLRLWVSGYDPRLDRYELDAETVTITNTVTQKRSRWGIGISGGYGVTLVGKNVQLSPYIGIGINYTFLSF